MEFLKCGNIFRKVSAKNNGKKMNLLQKMPTTKIINMQKSLVTLKNKETLTMKMGR